MNNYDQSSKGVNLDLSCFWDGYSAQWIFSENFKQLSDGIYQFIDYGNFEEIETLADPDLYSFTKEDLIRALKKNYYLEDLKDEALHYIGKPFSKLTKPEMIELMQNILYNDQEIEDFLLYNFDPKFKILNIRGYSQGESARIVFMNKNIDDYTFEDRSAFLTDMCNYFTNLFYSSPLFCRLQIDEEQIDFMEWLDNKYSYDKDHILEIAKREISHDKKGYILEWLEESLSDNPEYT